MVRLVKLGAVPPGRSWTFPGVWWEAGREAIGTGSQHIAREVTR